MCNIPSRKSVLIYLPKQFAKFSARKIFCFMTFIKHHRHHFGAFAILIIIAVVSGYVAFGMPNRPTAQQNNTSTQKNNTIQDTSNKIQTNNKKQIIKDEKIDAAVNTTSDTQNGSQQFNNLTIEQLTNQVTVRVDDKDYQTNFVSSTTVYDLMTKLKSKDEISFSGKEYSGMGFFVDEINGVKNDNLFGKYWIYYINGESAQVGISNYIIKRDDLIEWKYETTNL